MDYKGLSLWFFISRAFCLCLSWRSRVVMSLRDDRWCTTSAAPSSWRWLATHTSRANRSHGADRNWKYILHQTNPLDLFMIVYIDRLTSSVPLEVDGIRAALLCDKGRRSSREKTITFTKIDFSLWNAIDALLLLWIMISEDIRYWYVFICVF